MSFKEKFVAAANTALLKGKKHSPKALLVVGTIGFISTVVAGCKATTKLEEVLEKPKQQIEKIHEIMDSEELQKKHGYTQQDKVQDLTKIYIRTGWDLTKLYAPTIVLGTASLLCFLGSHNILSKRNAGLAAAYATIDKGFKEYRGRVVDQFGKEVDRELLTGVKVDKAVKQKGEEAVAVEETDQPSKLYASSYARYFDESCSDWKNNPEYNLMFLRMQEQHANDLLRAKGHLFLNEVYDMLGIPRTAAGQQVGWIYDEGRPLGDNFVDFGIYNDDNEKARDFVNGYESRILLDFNVDGVILDYI
nr:MAG TPA: hypothetical protein [Caudoviricetes sp.]